jgi:hypothetical protein
MIVPSALAAEKQVPVRAFNVFFGLGIPMPLQTEGFDGVAEPLKPLKDKLLIMRGVDHVRADENGINAHFDGSSAAFTATPPDGEAKAGGASIDQIVRYAAYPKGLPPGMVPTLNAGTFFRRSRISRYVHSYNRDGTVAGAMQESPREVFDRVFGAVELPQGSDIRKQRLRRSVLDSVVDQYRHYTGNNSPLGQASKGRVNEHLERIREYELRAFQQAAVDGAPPLPPRSQVPHRGPADPGGEGLDMTLERLVREWHLTADLYALAIEMDRVRFGAITFLAAGERLRLTGDYRYDGRLVYQFNDASELKASGSKGCSHEWWHKYRPERDNKQLRAHAHMKLREVAYFLGKLDSLKEPNGRSVLENSMITVSTESGDGRHNDVKRELSGVFHCISGGNGRFKTGEIVDVNAEGIDVYNTMVTAMGAKERLGPKDREHRRTDKILA